MKLIYQLYNATQCSLIDSDSLNSLTKDVQRYFEEFHGL